MSITDQTVQMTNETVNNILRLAKRLNKDEGDIVGLAVDILAKAVSGIDNGGDVYFITDNDSTKKLIIPGFNDEVSKFLDKKCS